MTALQEAAQPADFHEKVKGLDQGEVARLRGGVAVRRMSTEDGRDCFKVGTPSSWDGSGGPNWSGEVHRTPEDATRAAFGASARSTDPESIGGKHRLTTYGRYLDGTDQEVGIKGFDLGGHAVVTGAGGDRRVHPAQLMRRPLMESAETASLSVTHAPIGRGGTNWITRSRPGNTGQLPAYIQNVRNGIMRRGTDESRATQLAIGVVRNWASGRGRVSPEVRAAAARALAEYDAMRAKAKSSVSESVDAAFWLGGAE